MKKKWRNFLPKLTKYNKHAYRVLRVLSYFITIKETLWQEPLVYAVITTIIAIISYTIMEKGIE